MSYTGRFVNKDWFDVDVIRMKDKRNKKTSLSSKKRFLWVFINLFVSYRILQIGVDLGL